MGLPTQDIYVYEYLQTAILLLLLSCSYWVDSILSHVIVHFWMSFSIMSDQKWHYNFK